MTLTDLQRTASTAIKAEADLEVAKGQLSESLRGYLGIRGNGAKLSKLTGLSRAFLSDVLNGRRAVSSGLVEKLGLIEVKGLDD